ncbi:MAG: hypothetical protein ACLGHK_09590, partial [Alphaproteobacteria bacterium]
MLGSERRQAFGERPRHLALAVDGGTTPGIGRPASVRATAEVGIGGRALTDIMTVAEQYLLPAALWLIMFSMGVGL